MNTPHLTRAVTACVLVTAMTALAQTPPAAGLKLWLKADAITGLGHGDKVASWLDSSGSGNPATNTTLANQPVYLTNGINGLPVVRFNDSANGTPPVANAGQWLDSTVSVNANNASFTAIAVFRAQTTGGLRDTVLQPLDDGGNNGRTVLYVEPVTGGVTTGGRYVMNTFASALGVTGAGAYVTNSWTLTTVLQDTADDRLSLFRDGRLTGARTLAGAFATANGIWRIGDNKPRTGGLNGDVAEVLIYDRVITAAERADIDAYLANKYGLLLATNVLTETFDTADTFDLTADLAARQSGAAAPSSTYFSTQLGLLDVIEIKDQRLSISLQDTSAEYSSALVSPGDPLGSYVVNGRFTTSVDLRPNPASTTESWSGLKVASAGSLQGVPGAEGFSWIIFGAGAFQAFDGPNLVANQIIPTATRYTVCTVFDGPEYSISVNGTLLAVAQETNMFGTLVNGSAANFVTFPCFSTTNNMPSTSTYDNFTFTTIPEVVLEETVILADNFDTADTTNLDASLGARQTGLLAPAGYFTTIDGGATIAIEGNKVKISNPDNVFSVGMFFPGVDFLPYERSQSFRVRFTVNPTATGGPDSWAGVKIREPNASAGVNGGVGFGMLLRPGGGWAAFQGNTFLGNGGVAPAAEYEFDLEVRTNVLRAKINGSLVLTHTMPASTSPHYVTLMSLASTALGGPTSVSATFDDFEFAALGPAIAVPEPQLFNVTYAGGTASFQFSSVAGAVYIVEFKDSLDWPNWAILGNAVGNGGVVTVTDSTASGNERYYRLRKP